MKETNGKRTIGSGYKGTCSKSVSTDPHEYFFYLRLMDKIHVNSKLHTERKTEALLTKISDYKHASVFLDMKSRRHKASEKWFNNIPEYQAWLSKSESALLWIHGKPGAGKSFATTCIIDSLFQQTHSTKFAIAYFFVHFGESDSIKLSTILASLIKQQLSILSTFPPVIERMLERLYATPGSLPSTESLFELLSLTLEISDVAYIIIDGLDECLEQDRRQLLSYLLARFSDQGRILKIVLSSRSEVDISRTLARTEFSQVSLSTLKDRPDIESYIEDQIQERRRNDLLTIKQESLAGEIKKALLDGADGMSVLTISTLV